MYNQAREDYQFKDKPAPAQLWMPFLSDICEQAMETRKKISTNMVITMGLFSREQADFVRQIMKREGILVTFVDLQISDEEFLARNKARNRRKADMIGLSMEEFWDGRERMRRLVSSVRRMRWNTIGWGWWVGRAWWEWRSVFSSKVVEAIRIWLMV